MTLELWNKVRAVPETAKKKITGGRLNGFTDINPVYRLKVLTEQFGPCGIGWYYEITDKWTENGANEEIAVFVSINLYINDPSSGWSKPIAGTGGSMFVAKEKNGLYTSDECFKMALTDALSVACKALGIGADVYWDKDTSKYPSEQAEATKPTDKPQQNPPATDKPEKIGISDHALSDKVTKADLAPIIEICKNDPVKADKFRVIYKGRGYAKAEHILKADFPTILGAFNATTKPDDDTPLPFTLD